MGTGAGKFYGTGPVLQGTAKLEKINNLYGNTQIKDKKIVSSENTIVRSLVSRDCMQKQESDRFLKRKFGGSLPSFITAYLQDRKLTKEEAEHLQKLIRDVTED